MLASYATKYIFLTHACICQYIFMYGRASLYANVFDLLPKGIATEGRCRDPGMAGAKTTPKGPRPTGERRLYIAAIPLRKRGGRGNDTTGIWRLWPSHGEGRCPFLLARQSGNPPLFPHILASGVGAR